MKYFRCPICRNSGEANNKTIVYCCERCKGPMECFKQDDIVKSEAMIKGDAYYEDGW